MNQKFLILPYMQVMSNRATAEGSEYPKVFNIYRFNKLLYNEMTDKKTPVIIIAF